MAEGTKIFFLSPGPKYNLEHVFSNRCEMLSRDFHGTVLTAGPKSQRVRYGRIDIHCIAENKPRSLKSTLGFLVLGFRYLYRARKHGKPYDLFITYDPLKTGLLGAILCRIFDVKLVTEVNGDYTDDTIYMDIDNPIKRRLKKFSMVNVERYVLKRADGIKVLYDDQVESFKPFPRNPFIARFQDFVDANRFVNLGENKIVLIAGYPFWVKGVDVLIEAFKIVSPNYPEWKLKILGHYPNQEFLEQYIQGHPKIFHHPPVDPDFMPEHIGSCGIFVLASRTEAMGRVLLESMAAGKPRIGARVGGIPTVIEDGEDGLLFEKASSVDLAEKLELLMGDSSLRKKLGEKARDRYLREFQPDYYFDLLSRFYKECLKEKKVDES
ncbi:glycosyltransferase [Marinobacter sp. CHS3-4]|uniref:glycosyltransferase family 4 protein n=1 Tax=Marinobacter sp. CHS3-4 TaxID=3045174 RepID=UPI0024B4A201|nr:glycosyltransferase [Marinobacter sp. CHS3-4]MDI9245577.1 glycosyltransferase [Marinobacter sp. CHS3-4]